MCYILPNQKVFRQLFFNYLQIVFVGSDFSMCRSLENGFAGLIWPAGRSLETPALAVSS